MRIARLRDAAGAIGFGTPVGARRALRLKGGLFEGLSETDEEIADPQALAVRCLLNGRIMQSSSTADMIIPVAELVSRRSEDRTLLPGTLIRTGTPPGVGFARRPPVYLSHGDRVRVTLNKQFSEGFAKLHDDDEIGIVPNSPTAPATPDLV